MPQTVLPFQYESETQSTGLTDSAGLPVYVDLMAALDLPRRIEAELAPLRPQQGWTNTQQISALVLLQLAGGEALEHLDRLENDPGLGTVIEYIEEWGMYPSHREEFEKRWRIDKKRTVPSPDAAGEYLEAFDEGTEQVRREAEGAFVPEPSEPLQGLKNLVGFVSRQGTRLSASREATLDMDACLSESHKRTAKPCYKGFPGFQPLNVFWFEQGTVVNSQYRDGNCPAGWNQLEVLKEAVSHLPESVETLRLRADTAGYDTDLLKYCADPEAGQSSERFGTIEFATGVDVTKAFKGAVREVETWRSYHQLDRDGNRWETPQQWAQVEFVPEWLGYTKRDLGIRFFAIREPIRQRELLEDDDQKELTFPTMEFGGLPSKIYGVVTNRQDLNGEQLIRWLRGRCGWSEKVHSEVKYGLAGDRPPFSDSFQGNAAWWQLSWLAYNLHVLMQRLDDGGEVPVDEILEAQSDPPGEQETDSTAESRNEPDGSTTHSNKQRRLRRQKTSRPDAEDADAEAHCRSTHSKAPSIARIKTERFEWLRVSGRVIRHAGEFLIRIADGHPALETIQRLRRRIAWLAEQSARGPPTRWLAAV